MLITLKICPKHLLANAIDMTMHNSNFWKALQAYSIHLPEEWEKETAHSRINFDFSTKRICLHAYSEQNQKSKQLFFI